MLRHYYRILVILTGGLGAGIMGPYTDKGDNDIGLLQDFAAGVSGTAKPRLVFLQGDAWVEGQQGGSTGHPTFPATFFGAVWIGSYRDYAGNPNDIVDLTPNAPVATSGTVYGVANPCMSGNDVLTVSGTFGATMAAKYPDTATGPNPKRASIYAPSTYPSTTDHEAMTLVDGWQISNMGERWTLKTPGRAFYYYELYSNLFTSLNCSFLEGPPLSVGETPNNPLPYYLALRSQTPVIDGLAKIAFSIGAREQVEVRLYDAAGRQVRTLASRAFTPGEHDLYWDGLDEEGHPVARGIYFYQMRTPTFVSQKKLALLRR